MSDLLDSPLVRRLARELALRSVQSNDLTRVARTLLDDPVTKSCIDALKRTMRTETTPSAPSSREEIKADLLAVFRRHRLDVGVGLIKDGVAILSQDARVDAQNVDEVEPYSIDVEGLIRHNLDNS